MFVWGCCVVSLFRVQPGSVLPRGAHASAPRTALMSSNLKLGEHGRRDPPARTVARLTVDVHVECPKWSVADGRLARIVVDAGRCTTDVAQVRVAAGELEFSNLIERAEC